MKRAYTIFIMEFAALFPNLCLVMAAMTVMEALLFWMTLRTIDTAAAPFGYVIDEGNLSVVFALCFIGLLGLVIFTFLQNFTPSKSIYALLTLPTGRERVYAAKLAAALLAGFCLVAVQMGLVLVFLGIYKTLPPPDITALSGMEGTRNAALYLALLDSRFLRMLFPPDIFSLLFSISILCGGISFAVSAPAQVKAGRLHWVVSALTLWATVVIGLFPLTDQPMSQNVLRLIILLIFPIIMSLVGGKLFRSGEVAA